MDVWPNGTCTRSGYQTITDTNKNNFVKLVELDQSSQICRSCQPGGLQVKFSVLMLFLRREMFAPFNSTSCFSTMRICVQRCLYSLFFKNPSKSAKITSLINLFCIIHVYLYLYICMLITLLK